MARQLRWHEIRRRRKSPPSPFGFGRASEGGQKFLFPNPFPCPPERSVLVSAARSAAIIRDFAQKRFALRSVIATRHYSHNFEANDFRMPSRTSSTLLLIAARRSCDEASKRSTRTGWVFDSLTRPHPSAKGTRTPSIAMMSRRSLKCS